MGYSFIGILRKKEKSVILKDFIWEIYTKWYIGRCQELSDERSQQPMKWGRDRRPSYLSSIVLFAEMKPCRSPGEDIPLTFPASEGLKHSLLPSHQSLFHCSNCHAYTMATLARACNPDFDFEFAHPLDCYVITDPYTSFLCLLSPLALYTLPFP